MTMHRLALLIALLVALPLSLWLGLTWGALIGLMSYLLTRTIHLNQEISRIHRQIDAAFDALPERVTYLARQQS
ncbi:MAG: hypothetical protein PHI49_07095 [Halothiobacillaceae bacterium]|nr:hypothetical protein [Halothiobacillaceae bacterium]MDY0050060.1 hypothetical protein [Halothiobacillaceae bacterium]